MEKFLGKISPYIALLKPRYQIQFVEVAAGVVFAAAAFPASLLWPLVLLFISSHLLLYGGIYTMNDLRDLEEDKKDEYKRHRPLASGAISVRAGAAYAVLLVAAGLLMGYALFSRNIFYLHVLLLVLNILYTFALKRIPFAELIGNSLTHPPRFVMGALMAGGSVPPLFMLAYFFLAFGFTCGRRQFLREKGGAEHRPNTRHYTGGILLGLEIGALILIVLLAFADGSHLAWYLLMIAVYAFFVFGSRFLRPVASFLRRTYLK